MIQAGHPRRRPIGELTDIPLNPALVDGAPLGFVISEVRARRFGKSYIFVDRQGASPERREGVQRTGC